jgi:hypothetical protein
MARSSGIDNQQTRRILAVLITEGKVRERDARYALARYRKRIEKLRAELRLLEGGDGLFPPKKTAEWRSSRPARSKRVSAKRRKAMQQQGLYLAAVRPLKAQDRAKVKTVRQQKGFASAVAEARRLAKS